MAYFHHNNDPGQDRRRPGKMQCNFHVQLLKKNKKRWLMIFSLTCLSIRPTCPSRSPSVIYKCFFFLVVWWYSAPRSAFIRNKSRGGRWRLILKKLSVFSFDQIGDCVFVHSFVKVICNKKKSEIIQEKSLNGRNHLNGGNSGEGILYSIF